LKIYYYTLCWGNEYLNLLFKFSLKTFFSRKFTALEEEHKIFMFGYSKFKINKTFKKNISDLKKKKIDFKIINYGKEINFFKSQKEMNIWRFLGNFQKKAIMHAKKNNAMCCFIYPDEIHSENLCNKIIEKIKKYNFVFVPSNEIFYKDLKLLSIKNLTERSLIKIKYKFLEKYNRKDFFNYNFYCTNQPRFYFKTKDAIFYKSLHLAPIIINPNYIKNVSDIYTVDSSLNYEGRKKGCIIELDEGMLLSLENSQDSTRDHKFTSNLFILFLKRIILHIRFNFRNISGINPYHYLKTFKINSKSKNNFSLKKLLFFDLFSLNMFVISMTIKQIFNLKKYFKI